MNAMPNEYFECDGCGHFEFYRFRHCACGYPTLRCMAITPSERKFFAGIWKRLQEKARESETPSFS